MPRHRPFSCGSQAHDWDSRNCDRCKLYANREKDGGEGSEYVPETCVMRDGIDQAWFNDDSCVTEEVAKRMGLLDWEHAMKG